MYPMDDVVSIAVSGIALVQAVAVSVGLALVTLKRVTVGMV